MSRKIQDIDREGKHEITDSITPSVLLSRGFYRNKLRDV